MLLHNHVCVESVYLKVSIFQISTMQSIVYVCTSWRIHAADCELPQVLPLHHVLHHTSTLIHCTHGHIHINTWQNCVFLLPLVWWPTASWAGNWAQPERRLDGGRHAPAAEPPALCPCPLHCPDCAQSDPTKEDKTWLYIHLWTLTKCLYFCALYYISWQGNMVIWRRSYEAV